MDTNRKWDVLFITEDKSLFDSNTEMFNQVFNRVDKVLDSEDALKLIDSNKYDIIINDISVEPIEGIILLKKIKKSKPEQTIFALVAEKDSDKLYAIADLGVNAFELSPTQFDLALEEIAKFDPYLEEN